MDNEKVYNLAEAAAACGVSLPTIRRRREKLEEAGAVVDPKGWTIPHSALVGAGFDPSWTTDQKPQEPRERVTEAVPVESPTNELRDAHDRIRRLESENLVLRAHAEKWETIARERLDALNDQRFAIRALHAAPQKAIEPPKAEPAEPTRRPWWSRMWD